MLISSQWWPYKRKFHHRYYDPVPANSTAQEGFQNTFSLTEIEAVAARTMLDSGKYLPTSNMLAEEIFFGLWSKPNFREKTTNKDIEHWPVYGWNYDVLIGGLYPDQKAEWDYGLRGYTMELAFPVTMANKMLKRVRQLFDAELKKGIIMTSTYRSGINIKCEFCMAVRSAMRGDADSATQQSAKPTLTSSARSRTTRPTAPTGARAPSCSTSPRTAPRSATRSASTSRSVSHLIVAGELELGC